jgi:hypothetical protein
MGGEGEQRNRPRSKPVCYEDASDLLRWLATGTLHAVDGVIAYGTQGFKSHSGPRHRERRTGKSAFQGGLATAALGVAFHFSIASAAAAVFVLASRRLQILKTHAVSAGLLYSVAVCLFMTYPVLPLSVVAASTFNLGRFLNGVLGHALFIGLPISLFARRAQ